MSFCGGTFVFFNGVRRSRAPLTFTFDNNSVPLPRSGSHGPGRLAMCHCVHASRQRFWLAERRSFLSARVGGILLWLVGAEQWRGGLCNPMAAASAWLYTWGGRRNGAWPRFSVLALYFCWNSWQVHVWAASQREQSWLWLGNQSEAFCFKENKLVGFCWNKNWWCKIFNRPVELFEHFNLLNQTSWLS